MVPDRPDTCPAGECIFPAAMRVLLLHAFNHASACELYEAVEHRLASAGHEVTTRIGMAYRSLRPLAFQALVTHACVPPHWNLGPRCLGGRGWSRPRVLRKLAAAGVPVMPWARAAGHRGVLRLFERWGVDRLLLKRSSSRGGAGTIVFEPSAVARLRWHPRRDVFCPEVNEDDGDVYKLEACNGTVTASWVSRSPPLRDGLRDGYRAGIDGAYGERSLIDPPAGIRHTVERCSRQWTRAGIGYTSFDFMRRPDGAWVAIEGNTELVATWWTGCLPEVRERYAEAVQRWLEAATT